MKFTTWLEIAVSIALFVLGVTGNEFYKPHSEEKVPTWLGRSFFVLGAIFFALAAFSSLRHR